MTLTRTFTPHALKFHHVFPIEFRHMRVCQHTFLLCNRLHIEPTNRFIFISVAPRRDVIQCTNMKSFVFKVFVKFFPATDNIDLCTAIDVVKSIKVFYDQTS